MLKKLTYFILALTAVLATACTEYEENPGPDSGPAVMKFDMATLTKVSNDDVFDQEFIVYDYVDGQLYIDGATHTLKYDSDESSWRFYSNASGDPVDFYWTHGGTHKFYAWNKIEFGQMYESWDGLVPTFSYDDETLTLPSINLSYKKNGENYLKDLVYADAERDIDNSPDPYAPVNLEFRHAFTSLLFEFTNTSNQNKTVSDFSISGIKTTASSASLSFAGQSMSVTLDGSTTGSYSSAGELFTLAPTESGTVFGGPVMVWAQDWLISAAPDVNFTVNGKQESLDLYNELGDTEWVDGKQYHYVIELSTTTPQLILKPSAEISHTYSNGTLTGSEVTVTLKKDDGTALSSEELARITDLEITVMNSGGTTYKTYSAATVSSGTITFSSGPKLYMPQGGGYTVECSYKFDSQENTVEENAGNSPEPSFSVSSSYSTSSKQISVSASINISSEVLAEEPVQSCIVRILDLSGNYMQTWSIGNGTPTSPTFLSASWSGTLEQRYTLYTVANFDGKEFRVADKEIYLKASAFRLASEAVQNATDLKDGGLYFIRVLGPSNYYSTSNTDSYETTVWYNGGSYTFNLMRLPNVTYGSELGNRNCVFEFHRDDSKGSVSGYDYCCAGTWKALQNSMYLSASSTFNFNTSSIDNAKFLVIANKWTSDKGYQNNFYYNQFMEMSQAGNSGAGNLYTDKNGNVLWGSGGYNERKWEIIEVTPER